MSSLEGQKIFMFCCVREGASLFQSTQVSLWGTYIQLCAGVDYISSDYANKNVNHSK